MGEILFFLRTIALYLKNADDVQLIFLIWNKNSLAKNR